MRAGIRPAGSGGAGQVVVVRVALAGAVLATVVITGLSLGGCDDHRSPAAPGAPPAAGASGAPGPSPAPEVPASPASAPGPARPGRPPAPPDPASILQTDLNEIPGLSDNPVGGSDEPDPRRADTPDTPAGAPQTEVPPTAPGQR
jgi:hypothetical protein